MQQIGKMASAKISSLILLLFAFLKCGSAVPGAECNRTCSSSSPHLECEYFWTVQWGRSFDGANCGNCPTNIADCSNDGCIPLDGVERQIILTNGMMPGPNVEICQHDTVKITIQNLMNAGDTLSIHWHGQHQQGQPYMDGVPMITQCPIIPHTNFTYEFEPTTIGTHFWHSHSGLQRADGFYGGFIVREAQDIHASEYDHDDFVLVINDWYDGTAAYRFPSIRNPDSILINGMGRKYSANTQTPRAVFEVQSGQKYRFRVIQAGFNCPWTFSIDNHTLTVISTDGNPVQKYETDAVGMFLAERFDFVLTADQQSVGNGNFWIRVISSCNDPAGNQLQGVATLHYTGEADEESDLPDRIPAATGRILNPLSTTADTFPITNLTSAVDQIFPSPDKKYYIQMGFHGSPSPKINHVGFETPRTPLLTANISDISTMCEETADGSKTTKCGGDDDNCFCTHYMKWPLNQNIELVLFSSGGSHPMHMHGYYYGVVGTGKLSDYIGNEDITNEAVSNYDEATGFPRNPLDPVNKDTTIVRSGEYVIIRIYAKNPGWWFFHCHIDFHLEEGMAMAIWTLGDLPDAPPNWPACDTFPLPAAIDKYDGDKIFEGDCSPLLIATVIGWLVAVILLIVVIVLVCTRK